MALAAVLLRLAMWLDRRHEAPPHHPDDTTEGTGIPIPRVPPPLVLVGAAEGALPTNGEQYG